MPPKERTTINPELEEIYTEICDLFDQLKPKLQLATMGAKSDAQKARVLTLKLEKVMKEFRKKTMLRRI